MKAIKTLESAMRIPVITMGNRLEIARKTAGLEQTELALMTGLSRQTISNYERDAVHPRKSGIQLWSLATGVPVEWLETGRVPDFGHLGENSLGTGTQPEEVHPPGLEPGTHCFWDSHVESTFWAIVAQLETADV